MADRPGRNRPTSGPHGPGGAFRHEPGGRGRRPGVAAGGQGVHACESGQGRRGAVRMRRYLLDTNAAGDYIKRRRGIRERALTEVRRGNRIGICVPVLAELWFGVENSASRDRNLYRLMASVADSTVGSL